NDFLTHFGGGADFASVGAITLLVRTPAPGSVVIDSVQSEVGGPAVAATKTFSLATDADGSTTPTPGDTLGYSVTVTNSGGAASTTALSDKIDANTTLVPGSVLVSPVARDDFYSTTPVAAPGVLGNDLGTTKTITPTGARPTSGGGSATVAADGSFTYTAPVGANGTADTFTYAITDGTFTDTGVVTVIPPDLAPTVVTTVPDGTTPVLKTATITIN